MQKAVQLLVVDDVDVVMTTMATTDMVLAVLWGVHRVTQWRFSADERLQRLPRPRTMYRRNAQLQANQFHRPRARILERHETSRTATISIF